MCLTDGHFFTFCSWCWKSYTKQQSQHVQFAKLYKIALIVKSSDHNIALTHQEVQPCEKHSLKFKCKAGRKRKKTKKKTRKK